MAVADLIFMAFTHASQNSIHGSKNSSHPDKQDTSTLFSARSYCQLFLIPLLHGLDGRVTSNSEEELVSTLEELMDCSGR